MIDRNQTLSSLFSLWSIQNSILQSLRVILIGAETIVLSVATAIALSDQYYYLALVLSPLGAFVIWCWRSICENRGYDDSYLRSQIVRVENGEDVSEEVLTGFRKFQRKSLREKRRELSARNSLAQVLPSRTRIFLDRRLPLVFLLCWMLLLLSLALRVF